MERQLLKVKNERVKMIAVTNNAKGKFLGKLYEVARAEFGFSPFTPLELMGVASRKHYKEVVMLYQATSAALDEDTAQRIFEFADRMKNFLNRMVEKDMVTVEVKGRRTFYTLQASYNQEVSK
jgi:hypothetical protein